MEVFLSIVYPLTLAAVLNRVIIMIVHVLQWPYSLGLPHCTYCLSIVASHVHKVFISIKHDIHVMLQAE
jgi:hypothetical protein